jgi:hypothetical protein
MKTQAWGWLIAGVAALGLNGFYHDGGLRWAHQLADNFESRTAMVLALAGNPTDRLLASVEQTAAKDEAASCRMSTAIAQAETRIARSESGLGQWEGFSARQEAQLARIDANRARIEARIEHIRIPAIHVSTVIVPRIVACPRVQVRVPRIPVIKVPAAPVIHIYAPGAGPV